MNSNFEWAFFGGKPEGIKTLCAVTDAVGVPAFVTPPKDLPKADIDELSDAASALGCPVLSQEAAFNSSQNLTIGLCQRYDIIPAEQIQLPRLGFLNLHPSLLPKYRGVHPVSWAIINGETEAGATLHVIDAKVDTGPIVLQGSTPIDIHDDIWSVTHRCAEIATELAVTGMSDICHRGELPPVRAQIGLPSYAPRRTPKDSIFMPHTVTARQVFDLVRALRPPLPPAQIDLCNGFVEPVYHCSIEPVEGWRRLPVLDGYVWVETGPKSMS